MFFIVDEKNMSEQKQQKNGQQMNDQYMNDQHMNDQHMNEMLSAFIDAEQPDIETSQIIDALLNDSEYKEQYIRMQLINDHLHEQPQYNISCDELRNNITLALNDLPAHFSVESVSLQSGITENIPQSGWFQTFFKKSAENKLLSGLSVAASVMFVTLFTLQNFNDSLNDNYNSAINTGKNHSGDTLLANQFSFDNAISNSVPSLIQLPSALPASFASTASDLANINNQTIKQQYQWIEADPVLSRQVRQYINEHENRRAAYNLQPKIRTATYQISE